MLIQVLKKKNVQDLAHVFEDIFLKFPNTPAKNNVSL